MIMRLSQEDVDPLAHSSSSSSNNSNNNNNNATSSSSSSGGNAHGDKSSPLNIAAYEHLAEAGVDVLELSDTDSSARSTAQFQEKLNNNTTTTTGAAAAAPQHPRQQRHQAGAGAAVKRESVLSRGETPNIPMQQAQARSGGASAREGESRMAYPGAPRPGQFPPPPVKRQGAMSDLWQHQGAYRSNGKSMKSIFQEFSEELESPANKGRIKAEIGDIFSFTSVGHKHLMRSVPSEDRIAIHQAVVPKIDEATKKELDIETIDTTPFAMFGVFDGHGGPACAEFLTQSVSTVLAHSPVLYDEDLAPFERRACATADSFEELEKVHNTWAHQSGDLSGSTAILSTFQDGILVMAGVGDSAGLYVDHLGNKHTLCPQHSTSNAREVKRVLSMGGTIVNGRVAGCLMPTRTIGDLDCKRALGAIVSPHPELTLAAIYAPPDEGEEHDEPFLVLASDGLWDVLSNQEVARLTRKGLRSLRADQVKSAKKQEKAELKATLKNSGGDAKGDKGDGTSSNGDSSKTSKAKFWNKLSASSSPGVLGAGSSSRKSFSGIFGSVVGGGGGRESPTIPCSDGGVQMLEGGGLPLPLPGSSPTPAQSGGVSGGIGGGGTGVMDCSRRGVLDASRRGRGFMDGSRSGKGGHGDEYLDLSRRAGGLDASVRGGLSAAPIASASLDASNYAGLRASAAAAAEAELADGSVGGGGLRETGFGLSAGSVREDVPPKVVAVTSSAQTASVRTTGTPNQNAAMQLVHAAIRAGSMDDISVVVVTFQATDDKSAPGSRRDQRKGSNRSTRDPSPGTED